ncbi:MAG TPA: hypothetical protein VK445_11955 [Dissulfurispiraceae bacterium]|nr:hypothetical protein [Dissulfurispiraceae bacterium]
MSSQDGKQIARIVRMRMEEFREACKVLDEESASRAPEGRWTPKQVVSHLCGPAGHGHIASFKRFLQEDTPLIELEIENPFWAGPRADMTFKELLAEFEREYTSVACFVEGLSGAQMARKAHIPMLKESPMGEFPTLAQWILGLADFHIGFHIKHLKEILAVVGGRK